MRILPGSHRPIMEHWSRVLTPEHKAMLPRVHGLRPEPSDTASAYPEYVPELVDTPWLEQEPVAAVARRGQILVLCSGGLHSAWQNEDTVPRKGMGNVMDRYRRVLRVAEEPTRWGDGIFPTAAREAASRARSYCA